MIPDYQTLMLPVLQSCAAQEVKTPDVIVALSDQFGLTQEEREHLLPSGKQATMSNRVHWAKGYLKQAGLLSYTRRSHFIITDEGRKVLDAKPAKIDNKFLEKFEAFQEFRDRKSTGGIERANDIHPQTTEDIRTPDESLKEAHARINDAIARDLLDRVRSGSPAFFEQLLVNLLLEMGYGGTSEGVGKALVVGGPGDDGIDGVIDQDPLGLDRVYIQAKRYKEGNSVGPDAIRNFSGSLDINNAQKGVFVTASTFTTQAMQTAENVNKRIVLIDGMRLAKLMIRYNIGCRDEEILHLKKIDEEFFDN